MGQRWPRGLVRNILLPNRVPRFPAALRAPVLLVDETGQALARAPVEEQAIHRYCDEIIPPQILTYSFEPSSYDESHEQEGCQAWGNRSRGVEHKNSIYNKTKQGSKRYLPQQPTECVHQKEWYKTASEVRRSCPGGDTYGPAPLEPREHRPTVAHHRPDRGAGHGSLRAAE